MINKLKFLSVFALMTTLFAAHVKAESKHFPVPDIIKPNVAFWIRIYTEVGLQEGLLHDREYPQITYEKVRSGNRTGKARSDFIDGRRQIYVAAIQTVRDSAPNKWGAVEKRVADMFKNAPAGAIDSAEHRIRHQTGQRERFKAGIERSGAYIDTIAAILRQHGVPEELKYLPHVESSFDAEAYSKAGAAGLWQFMRGTGRGYMKIDYMFDERRDAIISTYAAAKFMRANYDMLREWPLAVTAYNHGPNGIRRAVESVGSRDIADILQKHESPSFKFASRNFYSCFVAVLEIMENPEKHFKNIRYKPRFEATNVKLPSAMTPNAILKATGVTEQEFKRLNPALRPVVFTQQRAIPQGYAINLPASIEAENALAAMKRTAPPLPQRPAPAVAARSRDSERITARNGEEGYYTVVRGDNMLSIARRLGIPMNELAAANNITNSSRIYVGQVLRIPGAAEEAAATTPTADTVATVALIDTIKTAEPTKTDTVTTEVSTKNDMVATATAAKADTMAATAPAPEIVPPVLSDIRITVTSSYDTTWVRSAVADTSGKETVAVAAVNDAEAADTAAAATGVLTQTAALMVAEEPAPAPKAGPGDKPAIDTRFDANVYDLGVTVAPGGASVQVRVSVDETIGHLAEWMRASADAIRRLNNISPNAPLPLGRRISIPINSSTNIQRFEVSRLQYHMAIEEDFFARYDVTDFERRRVKSGDNLWKICSEAQIPMWLLKKFNRNVRFYELRIGDTLWIPKIAVKDATHEVPELEFDEPVVTETDAADE